MKTFTPKPFPKTLLETFDETVSEDPIYREFIPAEEYDASVRALRESIGADEPVTAAECLASWEFERELPVSIHGQRSAIYTLRTHDRIAHNQVVFVATVFSLLEGRDRDGRACGPDSFYPTSLDWTSTTRERAVEDLLSHTYSIRRAA